MLPRPGGGSGCECEDRGGRVTQGPGPWSEGWRKAGVCRGQPGAELHGRGLRQESDLPREAPVGQTGLELRGPEAAEGG